MKHISHNHTDTCEFCPFFKDYDELNGRGWCLAFETQARKYHVKSSICELLGQNCTVMVQLYTRAEEDDGNGHPVPVDSRLFKISVAQPTKEDVEAKIRQLFDLNQWEIHSFWEPSGQFEI
ncbi:MAG: hypothetical protein N5P05_004485 (plasmid) [Chroococcopsis gigantea SAG 12.99]|jgi:hypothetical protein|nr:hypothetical protein [Chroococcopsis gigantea SAG 12.99]